jgi:adenylate kinase
MKTVILFLGPPGCGKGTQSKIISKKLGITSYSVGDLLRSYAESNSSDSLYIEDMIKNGLIIPGDLVNSIVSKLFSDVFKTCILDGYPRNLEQALFLNQCDVRVIPIYFKLEESLLLDRILNRWQCQDCGLIYNAKLFNLDVYKFKCPECNSTKLYQRDDDSYEVLQNRIKQFTQYTLPVLNFYRDLNLLFEIDGAQNVNKVNVDLDKIIENLDIDIRA